jgi:hypothetical protein
MADPSQPPRGGAPAPLPPALQVLARARRRIHGVPLAVRLVVLVLAAFVVFPFLHALLLDPRTDDLGATLRLLLLSVVVPTYLVVLWQRRRHEKLAAQTQYEPALNHLAIEWLRVRGDFDRVKLEGELPRETVLVTGWRRRWLLVTNRRVLLFSASRRERRLRSEWPRRSVVFAGRPEELLPNQRPSTWLRLLRLPPNLTLCFTTGTTLHLRCASSVTAQRVAELLMSSPALEAGSVQLSAAPHVHRRWYEVLASFVLPGAGQWLQGRLASGTVLFTAALVLFVLEWGPLVQALSGVKPDMSPLSLASALVAWVLLALLAGADSWHFSATGRPRR